MARELDSLIARFAELRGLPVPRLDQHGRYHFVLDGQLEIGLFQNGNWVFLEGKLDPIPESRAEVGRVLAHSLRRHLGRLRNHLEVLCVDPDEGCLVLYRQLSAQGLRIDELESAMGELANGLAFWLQASGDSRRPAPPPPMQMLFP